MKSRELFYENYITLFSREKNKLLYKIILTQNQCMAYYPKWFKQLISKNNNEGTAQFCHVLCLEMPSNVMLRFMVQALKDPPLCSSTRDIWCMECRGCYDVRLVSQMKKHRLQSNKYSIQFLGVQFAICAMKGACVYTLLGCGVYRQG